MSLLVSGLSAVHSGRTILQPTSLAFSPGERVGLVGASGSGKSTLGHALVDALRARGERVAHVPQSPGEALDPLRSLGFHWHEAERALGVPSNPVRRQSLFRALAIDHGDLNKRPWAWSRGMQQRFVIALALIGAPALIVLDEPTSALDPVVAADSMNLLDNTLEGTETATLLITHDLGLAARRVRRLLVLDGGHIVEDVPTEALLETPKSAAAAKLVQHRSWVALPC